MRAGAIPLARLGPFLALPLNRRFRYRGTAGAAGSGVRLWVRDTVLLCWPGVRCTSNTMTIDDESDTAIGPCARPKRLPTIKPGSSVASVQL